jgi:pyruvate/2-oxoglutarate dehydrogenase complex dihydrolipoamide acyltransferase (E2) component
MAQNILVPNIGDFKDVEVIEVLVKPGDSINKNDSIITIESDKSSIEIPSLLNGEIIANSTNLQKIIKIQYIKNVQKKNKHILD